MANVEHAALTGASLHEPKGVAAATSGQVYVANGSGGGTWTTQTTPALVLISTVAISSQSSVDLVNGQVPTNGTGTVVLDNTYDAYQLELSSVKFATNDSDLLIRIGTGGGPTYQTSGYKYYTYLINEFAGFSIASGSANGIYMTTTTVGLKVGNASGENFCATVKFSNPEDTNFMNITYSGAYNTDNSTLAAMSGNGVWATAGAVTAVRFLSNTGNLASGRISLYGLKKS